MPRRRGRSSEDVALALLVTMEVPNFYSKHLPSELTIYKFAADAGDRAALRRGERKATVQALILGVAASILSDSLWPVIGVTAMTAYQVYDTEMCIRRAAQNPDVQSIDKQQDGYVAGAQISHLRPKRWGGVPIGRGSFLDVSTTS